MHSCESEASAPRFGSDTASSLVESTTSPPTLTSISLGAKPSPYGQWNVCFQISIDLKVGFWSLESPYQPSPGGTSLHPWNSWIPYLKLDSWNTDPTMRLYPTHRLLLQCPLWPGKKDQRPEPDESHNSSMWISTSASFSSRCFAWIFSLDPHSSHGNPEYHFEDKKTDVEKGHGPTRHRLAVVESGIELVVLCV